MEELDKPDEASLTTEALRVVRAQLRSMEQTPAPYLPMDEENLRLVLMNPLNSVGMFGATAESFSNRGKVDILIRRSGAALRGSG